MNKEKILKLADFIEKSDSFSMHWPWWDAKGREDYGEGIENTEDGCPACILGHLRVMEGNAANCEEQTASSFFGVSRQKAKDIISPISIPYKARYRSTPNDKDTYISKTMACNMLRNFVQTGEVEWRVEH